MTIGKKFVVVFHEEVDTSTPIIDSIDFTGQFSYNGAYASNVVVKKDDQASTVDDRFIVTYFWANGEGPNLASVTVAAMLSGAVAQVNAAMPGEAGP